MAVASQWRDVLYHLLRNFWRRLKRVEFQSDFVLLMINPYFIPKKLLKDILRHETVELSGGVVIDVGCGSQPYRLYFRSVERYIGIDLAPYRRPDVVATVEQLPLKDAIADVMLCTEVIEHTREPKQVCSELVRVLRPGGTLLLSAPMSWSLHYRPYDYYRFTCYGLIHLLEESGLEIAKVMRIGGLISLIGARLTDVVQQKVQRLPLVKQMPGRSQLACMLVAPLNVIFYFLGRVFDRVDHADAIGWFVAARKPKIERFMLVSELRDIRHER